MELRGMPSDIAEHVGERPADAGGDEKRELMGDRRAL